MLEACVELSKQFPYVEFVMPAANQKIHAFLRDELAIDDTPVKLVLGHSRDALALCHLAVLASGTAALEAALFAKPMVVMYKVAKMEQWYAAQTMVVKHFSMPNHLINPPIVPELIQGSATTENMMAEVSRLLDDQQHYRSMQQALSTIAPQLSEDSGQRVCDGIELLISDMKSDKKPRSDSEA